MIIRLAISLDDPAGLTAVPGLVRVSERPAEYELSCDPAAIIDEALGCPSTDGLLRYLGIGSACRGTSFLLVNGSITISNTELSNGDRVEVLEAITGG